MQAGLRLGGPGICSLLFCKLFYVSLPMLLFFFYFMLMYFFCVLKIPTRDTQERKLTLITMRCL